MNDGQPQFWDAPLLQNVNPCELDASSMTDIHIFELMYDIHIKNVSYILSTDQEIEGT